MTIKASARLPALQPDTPWAAKGVTGGLNDAGCAALRFCARDAERDWNSGRFAKAKMSNTPTNSFPDISLLRVEYRSRSLSESDVDPDPLRQFAAWLNQAIEAKVNEPNAMTLATCTRDGIPAARIVLLKGLDAGGLVFYTNYLSRKGQELAENPKASLLFFWPELERQVRLEGRVTRTTETESDRYFESRPVEARIGSAASPQSATIASRDVLVDQQRELIARYPDGNVPRPSHWGGYRLHPHHFEFWQGGAGRLHDRIVYNQAESGWVIERLAP
jgi:pyridoxamine 5'-phosphate oxidase